jgi:tight adherence protein C
VTLILLAGALAGLGVLTLGLVLAPPRPSPAAALAQLDAARGRLHAERLAAPTGDPGVPAEPVLLRRIGERVRALLNAVGIELGGIRSDLSMLGRSLESHLAISLLAGLGGFLFPVVVEVVLSVFVPGLGVSSLIIGVVVGLVCACVPTLVVRSKAEDRRRDFRHVVSSFLDLVAMNLAGGRGVPEALQSASEISDGWAMVRIREALSSARLHGVTPWAALGELGATVRVDELVDLGAALALVAEDGAKVRESLAARATSMRRRELSAVEGKAGEQSQSMLVAQILLCVGFLIFLAYPAVVGVLGAQ